MSVWQWFTDPANWSGENGIPVRTGQYLLISIAAMAIALIVALPVGLILGHVRKGTLVATNIGNIGRAVPVLAVLIIFASMSAIGVGDLAAVLALAIFAIPPLLTNTFAGMAAVDEDARAAAHGMGMSRMAIIFKVEVPLAMPLIAAGVRTASVQVVATASLAALVGSGGLGRYVVDGFETQNGTLIMAGAILVAVVSLAAEGLMALLQRQLTPVGIRRPAGSEQPGNVAAAEVS